MHLHKLLVCAVVVVDTTCLDMQLHTEDRRDNVFEFIRVTYGGKEETTCLNLSGVVSLKRSLARDWFEGAHRVWSGASRAPQDV